MLQLYGDAVRFPKDRIIHAKVPTCNFCQDFPAVVPTPHLRAPYFFRPFSFRPFFSSRSFPLFRSFRLPRLSSLEGLFFI